ncbi:MAG TPA: hypothetical protein VJI15_02895 [Candidatus Nanoarchaeia archaeon]|nr:hypothetical protein [Candidatus Nanoarchaeia archaeon]
MANVEPVKKVSRIKVKKKLWYKIISPRIFGLKEMGESYLANPQEGVGRKMKIGLKDLTGNVKDQNVYVSFIVTGANGGKLTTSVIGYQLTPSHVRRLVKKNVDRKDDYFTFTTKEGKEVVAKTLMITINKTKRSVRTELSKQLKEGLAEEISKLDVNTLFNNLVYHKIQLPLKKKLSKVYPLRELAIRHLFLKDQQNSDDQTVDLPEQAPVAVEAPVVENASS